MVRSTYYWQEGNAEVDFVLEHGRSATAVVVKSGRKESSAGLEAFRARHPKVKILRVGTGGIPLEQFFSADPEEWLE